MYCRELTRLDFPDVQVLLHELTEGDPNGGLAQFETVLMHTGTTIFGCISEGRVVAIATLHLLPNITQSGRPYGVVENVVTLAKKQNQGYGRLVLETIIAAAWEADAYKIMLLTGRGRGARQFYEKLGFSSAEKYGMVIRRTS